MKLVKTYDYACIDDNMGTVEVDGEIYTAEIGKHSVWIPALEAKFPFQYNGHFIEYRHWDRGQHAEKVLNHTFGTEDSYSSESLFNILEEYMIFEAFYGQGFSPQVKGFFYIKNLISDFPYGAMHCDPKGVYGFYFENAHTIPTIEFDVNRFREKFIDSGFIECSESALSDLLLESRCNHVNGYVVDIRRSIQDAIHLTTPDRLRDHMVRYVTDLLWKEEPTVIQEAVGDLGQFPYKDRSQPYQGYWLGNEYVRGSRDINHRFAKMKVPRHMDGNTVLDLGCSIGSVCQESYNRGARQVVGLDNQVEYIHCARDIARYNGHQINFLPVDLTQSDMVCEFANAYFKDPIDVVFALAIYKHIGYCLFEILDNIKFKILYVESSSCKDETTPHVMEVDQQLKRRYNTEFLGFTEDRSKRAIWRCFNV